jgi:hypothetical protein
MTVRESLPLRQILCAFIFNHLQSNFQAKRLGTAAFREPAAKLLAWNTVKIGRFLMRFTQRSCAVTMRSDSHMLPVCAIGAKPFIVVTIGNFISVRNLCFDGRAEKAEAWSDLA